MAQEIVARTNGETPSIKRAGSVAEAIHSQLAFPKAGPASAAKAASQLLSFYPSQTPNSPREYMAAIVSLLAEYPVEVIEVVCDPRRGLATRCKFLPTLAELTEALQSEMEPHNQAWHREREKQLAIPRMDRAPPTAEERARVESIRQGLSDLGKKDPLQDLRDRTFEMQAERFKGVVADVQKKKPGASV